MKITQKESNRFLLLPKPGSAGTVSEAEIEVDPVNKLIRKVALTHRGGNHSEVTLSKIRIGDELDDRLFKFTPPPNTERIRE